MDIEFKFFDDEDEFVDSQNMGEERCLKVRLDKWLWAARFFKTRALARAAVEAGKVYYNQEKSKPSREIEVGAELRVRLGYFEKTVIVKGLSTRRRSTTEALQLFEETETSKYDREQQINNNANYSGNYASTYAHAPYSDNFGNSEYYQENRERRPTRFLRRSLVKTQNVRPNLYENNYESASQPFFPDYDEEPE